MEALEFLGRNPAAVLNNRNFGTSVCTRIAGYFPKTIGVYFSRRTGDIMWALRRRSTRRAAGRPLRLIPQSINTFNTNRDPSVAKVARLRYYFRTIYNA